PVESRPVVPTVIPAVAPPAMDVGDVLNGNLDIRLGIDGRANNQSVISLCRISVEEPTQDEGCGQCEAASRNHVCFPFIVEAAASAHTSLGIAGQGRRILL